MFYHIKTFDVQKGFAQKIGMKRMMKMGYILPINYEQYTLYQVRDMKSKYNVYQINQKRLIGRSQLFQEKARENLYSEVTGKGKFIDKRV
jgi:hypothetical protein